MLDELGVDLDKPLVAFVGRITRQKGVAHLVAAAHRFSPDLQLVLCAGAPDTPEIAAEVTDGGAEPVARSHGRVLGARDASRSARSAKYFLLQQVFVCPSVYEPLGIVNLEAMACATAVVASDVGGIPEVVADGETGSLVHYDAADGAGFEARLANAVNTLARRSGEGEKVRQGRPATVHRRVLLGPDRRADARDLPKGELVTNP